MLRALAVAAVLALVQSGATSARAAGGGATPTGGLESVRLRRVSEPREQAFTILVPVGWSYEGGVLRLNPFKTNGVTNTVGAKFDFAVKSDAQGTVTMHWLPSITYCDTRSHPDGGRSFPPGSSYQGMPVVWFMDPLTFLERMVFQKQHPTAAHVQVVERRSAPELAKAWNRNAPRVAPGTGIPHITYAGGVLTVSYEEGGVRFRDRLMTVIERSGFGMWTNKDALVVRAPADQFDRALPLFALVQDSLRSNVQWAVAERRGSQQRMQKARETQAYLQKVGSEIAASRRQMNAEIRHSMWLDLTSQEDYVNPHTGEVEQGSNQWKHRWIAGNGDVVYTNDARYDPNHDDATRHTDYRRSEVRQR